MNPHLIRCRRIYFRCGVWECQSWLALLGWVVGRYGLTPFLPLVGLVAVSTTFPMNGRQAMDNGRRVSWKGDKVKLWAIAMVCVALSGCSVYSPDAGHEVVLVDKPWIFGHGGVESAPVKTGRTFAAISTEGVDVYMQPQKFESEMADMMTQDGVPITFHAIAVLQVIDSVKLIQYFGADWYKNNLEEPFKTMVRQAVRKHGMNETVISTVALDAIDEEIRAALAAFIKDKGLPVQLVTMTVGRANPPDAIKTQRIETATQEQRIQTEKQTKLAEDQRQQAEQSRANADNAYREAMHLSPEQFIQLETIKMQRDVCGLSGKANCTFIQNGASPVYNLGR